MVCQQVKIQAFPVLFLEALTITDTMAVTKISIQLEAVCGLVEKLGKIIEIDEDIEAVVEKHLAMLREQPDAETPFGAAPVKKERKTRKQKLNADGTPKKKRDPSPYNMFVSEHWAMLTEQGFKGPELIRQAALLWNNRPKPEADVNTEVKTKNTNDVDEETEVDEE